MVIKRICPTCNKRDVVVDNGCAICLFFRSDEEQERFHNNAHWLLMYEPEMLLQSRDKQVYRVISQLPYICTYKAKYMKELKYFINLVLDQITEYHTIDIDESYFDERKIA